MKISSNEIKILILEDSPADAELLARELRKSGIKFFHDRVENKADFVAELEKNPPSIILADYSLPLFDGLAALILAREKCPDTPFIFVSGTIGEERAVEALKNGATDYVIKDRLNRLPLAVRNALYASQEKKALKIAEEELAEYRDHLEKLVRERTEKLMETNRLLELEIAEHKRDETALRASEERFRNLAEAMPQIVWEANPAGKLDYFNQRAYDYGGFQPGSIRQWNWSFIIHPQDRKTSAIAWSQSIITGDVYSVEQRIRRCNGEHRWHLTRAVPVRDDEGNVLRWIGTSTDIHDQKLAEKKYATILQTTQNGFLLLDMDGNLLEVNQAYSDMSGRSREELLKMNAKELEANETPEEVDKNIKSLREQVHQRFEGCHRRKDGSLFDVEVSATYLNIEGERVVSFVRDITERRKIDQMKDEFIGMVSHEIKTPLTIIMGALSTALSEGLPQDEAQGLLHDALDSTEVLSNIVENLLELSRSQSNRLVLRKESSDIKQIANNVARQLRRKSAKHQLIVDMPDNMPSVDIDRFRAERVFYNLIDNAIKYSPKGGDIKIFASQEPDKMVVGVRDQGIGINAEEQAKLFRKFQRLAMVNSSIQGVGLGLNVCRILVEAHGGQIWVESEKCKGSTFYFTIPLTNNQ